MKSKVTIFIKEALNTWASFFYWFEYSACMKKNMKRVQNKKANYAFIDNENVNVSVKRLWWKIDRTKFRKWLKKDFDVEVAYLFMGYMPEYQKMYDFFESIGYTLIFKKVRQGDHIPNKGNIDTDLVLHTMIQYSKYHQAVIVSGDGDFTSLVEHLANKKKLRCVIAPNKRRTSDFLQEATEGRFLFLDGFKRKLAYTGSKWWAKKKKEDEEEPFWHQ